MNRSIKFGIIFLLAYLILHFSTYYLGQPQKTSIDENINPLRQQVDSTIGFYEIVFLLINFPVNLIIGTFSHNSISAVNQNELLIMGLIGAVIYFMIGFLMGYVKDKIEENKM